MTLRRGFTLIELLVVMAIVATLLTIAVPRYFGSVEKSREAALKQTLAVTRDAIDKYHGDHGRYPPNLHELVARHYMRRMPVDPITESDATWVVVPAGETGIGGDVLDVKSGAPGKSTEGTAYAEW